MISALAAPPVATMPLPGEKNDRAIGGEVERTGEGGSDQTGPR